MECLCWFWKSKSYSPHSQADDPGDIGYYHNKGYSTDAPSTENGGKHGISWVNERNGVETIPYNMPVADKNSNSETATTNKSADEAPPPAGRFINYNL